MSAAAEQAPGDPRHNTARYFVDNPHVSLVLLVIAALAGAAGYKAMPKQKDPTIPVRVALAVTPWPGIMGESRSFMAFLGLVSLVGVIVSHIIVLFIFIEERRRDGETLELALLDAGIVRLRPVLITVSATVLALIPLAYHGGPLWQPLCYAQIGGLTGVR